MNKKLKVLMLNGSPRKNGNIALAFSEMEKIFEQNDVEYENILLGRMDIRGCIACETCRKNKKCAFDDIVNELAVKFEGVAAIEKTHEERYRKLLSNVRDKKVFSKDGDAIWVCRNCGHVVIGKEAPEICPVCAHPRAYFEVKAENY